jgi:hypothetical protein
MKGGLLEVAIFGFGERKLLGFLTIENVLVLGQFQNELKSLPHAILNEFLLCLL